MEELSTFRSLIENSERLYSQNTAFILKDGQGQLYNVSYKSFLKDIDCFGEGLYSLSDKKDIKVAICADNCYEWCVTYFAVTSGKGVIVPVDKDLPSQQLKNLFMMSDTDIVVCDNKIYDKIIQFYGEDDVRPIVILISNGDTDACESFEKVRSKGEKAILKKGITYLTEDKDENSLSVLLFTSGTTGVSKGIMLSEKNICSDIIGVCKKVSVTQSDVTLSVLPLHHTYEAIAFLMVIYSGGAISFCQNIRYLRQNLKLYRPTVLVTVPLMLEKLLRAIESEIADQGKRGKVRLLSVVSGFISEEKKKKIFSAVHQLFGGRLKKIIVGAAPMNPETSQAFELFGIPVIFGYGLTECSPIVICNSDSDRKKGSIGKPLCSVQVKIENPDSDGIGEICVKGPMVMLGYYNNKAATDEALIDGFLHTGDLGYCDENGYYYITGRSKNVMVTSTGKNIYPEEIEAYLNKYDIVEEVVVSQTDGEFITAQIFPNISAMEKKLKKRNPSETEIKVLLNEAVRSVNRKLPSYKRIKKLIVRNEGFAKTTTHKIKRYDQQQ